MGYYSFMDHKRLAIPTPGQAKIVAHIQLMLQLFTKISRRADDRAAEGLLSDDPREAEVAQFHLRELLV